MTKPHVGLPALSVPVAICTATGLEYKASSNAEDLLPPYVVDVPPARRETHDYLDLYWWKHSIYALLDVDVAAARQLIREHEAQTCEALSFTGYLTFCLARAVDEDKSVQAYPKGRKHLVIFDDVDVFLPVEREEGKTHFAIPYVIRRANDKSSRANMGWPRPGRTLLRERRVPK